MKKYKLLTISILFAGLTSFAANGDRFKSGDIWYEVIDESAKTCKTAPAQDYTLNSQEENINGINTITFSVTIRDKEGLGEWETDNQNKTANGRLNNVNLKLPVKDDEGNTYTLIGIGAFSFANGWAGKIELPSSVKFIEEGAFMYMNINTLDLGNVERIDRLAFYKAGISAQANDPLVLPGSEIGEYAFARNTNLRGIKLSENLTTLGKGSFSFTSIEEIEFPGSVKDIPDYLFLGSQLQRININEGVKTISASAFEGVTSLTTVTIPGTVETIEQYTFAGNGNLSNLILGDGIQELGEGAFSGCKALKNINIPGSVKDLPDYVFKDCDLENVIIGEGVTAISATAFEGVKSLKSLEIPGTVKTIEPYTFAGNGNLSNLILGDGIQELGEGAFSGCKALKNINIPGSVRELPDYVFKDCDLENVKIGDGVTAISATAFEGVKSLKSLEIPGSVKTIEPYTFAGNDQLTKLILNNGIENIGEGAFSYTAPDSLVFPESIKYIGDKAFMGCASINSVTFNEGLISIGNDAFNGCRAIKGYLTFPDSLEEIGDRAFYGVSSIAGLYFGSNLRKVGKEAFFRINMDPQSSWVFPPSLTEIGENAFNTQNKNTTFTDIYYPNPEPNSVDCQAFGFVEAEDQDFRFHENYWMYATVCLHVPVGTIEKYKKCDGWKHFKCIIDDLLPEDPETKSNNSEDPLSYILDYIYLVPGDEINLTTLLGQDAKEFIWNEIHDCDGECGDDCECKIEDNDECKCSEFSDILSLDKDGNVRAKSYGNVIALARRTNIKKNDGNGNEINVPDAIVGAAVIFVCPTITVVYDKDGLTDAESVTGGSANSRQQVRTKVEAEEQNEATMLQSSNTTYSHPVVYNSFPKVQVNPTGEIEIQSIERASLDSDNNYIPEEDEQEGKLTQVEDGNFDKEGKSGYTGAVLPVNPVTEDRMIVVNLAVPYGITTETAPIEIDNKISVVTANRTLRIIGADEASVVRVVNLQGQTVYQGTAKVIDLEPGVYVITVEEAAFKALVK